MKKFNLIKIFNFLILFLFLGAFFSLIDIKDLSFKTIVPEAIPEKKTKKSFRAGIIKNTEENFEESEQGFWGNEIDIINLVNLARKENGLEILTENHKLNLSAQNKAQHMKDNDYFDHVSPEGLQPWFFVQKNDYNYKSFGENLAEGYFSAESVHQGWMNSEGHRENILSENFEEIGVAILEFQQEGQKSYLLVQHFGSQLTADDLKTEVICEKESEENCKEAEEREEHLDGLIKEQEKIIRKAKDQEASEKEIRRLEENLKDLKEADDEAENYLEECEKFLKKCDRFE